MTVTVKMKGRRTDSASSLKGPRSNSIRLRNMSQGGTSKDKMIGTGTEEIREEVVEEEDQ